MSSRVSISDSSLCFLGLELLSLGLGLGHVLEALGNDAREHAQGNERRDGDEDERESFQSSSEIILALQGGAAAEAGGVLELLFDSEQAVVFGDAVGTAGRTGLDLTGVERHREISDRRIFGFARTVGDHRGPTCFVGHLDGGHGLGQSADLIELDEHRIGDPPVDALGYDLRVGHEQIVADHLDAVADGAHQSVPAVPVALRETVLDGDDGKVIDQVGVDLDHLLGGEADPAFAGEVVLSVGEELGCRRVHGQADLIARECNRPSRWLP